jgi:hypothetical protein
LSSVWQEFHAEALDDQACCDCSSDACFVNLRLFVTSWRGLPMSRNFQHKNGHMFFKEKGRDLFFF